MDEAKPRAWIRPLFASLAPTFREVLALSFFVNLLALAVPVFVLQVYDRVVFHAGLSTLEGLAIGMAFVLAFDYVLRQSRARILQTLAVRMDVQVGRRLFDKLTSLPLATLESQPAAHWNSLFRDADLVRNTVSGPSALLAADLPFALLFLALAFVIAPAIAWVLLLALPLFLLVAWRSAAAMATATHAEREAGLARDRLMTEMIGARATVKALALDQALRPKWEDRHAAGIERALVRGSRADGYTNLGTTLTLLTTVTLTAVGAVAIINQNLTIGALIATNLLSGRLLGPLTQLVGMWRTYAGFWEAVERLGRTFALSSEREADAVRLDRPRGDVDLEAVTFAYGPDARPVIDGLSLSLKAPGIFALIGRNGSGKTTLIKLIQSLYRPTAGRVLLDGADLQQFSRSQVAAWIGYVPQESVLFAGTIRENIALRRPAADDEEVIAAAKAAGAHAFIVDLHEGYGAEVGEGGVRLSAGQRQRLAIARALLGDPPVLVLDEPSSSLDRQAEQELRATLAGLGKERTVLIVTHSPLLLSACDQIIALDRGRIAIAGASAEILPRLMGSSRQGTASQPARPAVPPTSEPAVAVKAP